MEKNITDFLIEGISYFGKEESSRYIYVLWDYQNMPLIDNTRIKIGISKNPEIRTRSIITQSGLEYCMPLVYIKLKNNDHTETDIHKYFKEYRSIGEWFNINPFEAIISIYDFSERFEGYYIPEQTNEMFKSIMVNNLLDILGIDLKTLGK